MCRMTLFSLRSKQRDAFWIMWLHYFAILRNPWMTPQICQVPFLRFFICNRLCYMAFSPSKGCKAFLSKRLPGMLIRPLRLQNLVHRNATTKSIPLAENFWSHWKSCLPPLVFLNTHQQPTFQFPRPNNQLCAWPCSVPVRIGNWRFPNNFHIFSFLHDFFFVHFPQKAGKFRYILPLYSQITWWMFVLTSVMGTWYGFGSTRYTVTFPAESSGIYAGAKYLGLMGTNLRWLSCGGLHCMHLSNPRGANFPFSHLGCVITALHYFRFQERDGGAWAQVNSRNPKGNRKQAPREQFPSINRQRYWGAGAGVSQIATELLGMMFLQ